ncbi:hypothetical protein [Streptomyces griseiscabiei]|uniref:Hemin transport protein n=1 Tax=Streptomyces griseiscabiei TaxID=2993540 RepID=A0ABU4LFH9_9ACTN|nr:hypothetical protein [Streptomyces griseiscabiei]MBZ3906698.1 hypothetical protein [Streptomyces griseiscabiei]MDX2913763.1 hypothetical protein [Streptomyces griseiscabiei]
MTDHHGCGFGTCRGRRPGTARLIDPRMPELARSLTLFRYVHAVTGGPVARLDQAGGYAPPTLRGEAFTVAPGPITLRLAADGVDTAVVARDTEDAVVVRLLSPSGRTVHEGRLLSEGDRLLAGLAGTVEAGAGAGAPGARERPGVHVPSWENGDQLAQLDAILADGGAARRAALTRRGDGHREVDPAVLPALLDHVCSAGLPIGVAVFAPSVMQACAGAVHVTDRTVGGRVYAAVANASLELDLPAVRSCHLVRSTATHGPTSALELDDEHGDCVALITQFGIVGEQVHGAWEHLAASLPDA